MWPFRKRKRFSFHPEWKERMIVVAPGGSFVLDFPMGIPTAVLPSEERWAGVAPDWAKGLWRELHDELEAWCRESNVIFQIHPKASVAWSES